PRISPALLLGERRAMVPGVVATGLRERPAGPRLHLLTQTATRLEHQATDDHGCAGCYGRAGIRDDPGVLPGDVDVLDWDAELRRRQLREDRLRPLPHLGRRREDGDPSVGGQLDRSGAGQVDL